jgi:hypothetical protein
MNLIYGSLFLCMLTGAVLAALVCAPFLRVREVALIFAFAAAAYVPAAVVWFLGWYFRVFAAPPLSRQFLLAAPPAVFQPVAGFWLATLLRGRRKDTLASASVHLRRLMQLALVCVLLIAFQVGDQFISGWHSSTGSEHDGLYLASAVAALGAFVLFAAIRDRNAELNALLTGISLLSLVPIVLLGRIAFYATLDVVEAAWHLVS